MKGLYILLIELPEATVVQTRNRVFNLNRGYYAYLGSAMGGREARIERHLSSERKHHWHIDFLLDKAGIQAVISCETEKRAECLVAQHLADLAAVAGFGCSDCRCRSHLFYSKDFNELTTVAVRAFEAAGLKPVIWAL